MPQCQFLFFAVFVFQKSYIGNILGIGQNKAQSSYFPQHEIESKAETEEGKEVATPPGGVGPPWLRHHLVWFPWCPLTSPLRLYKASDAKTLNELAYIHEKLCSAAAIEDEVQGTEVSIPAPYWDGELPPELSPLTPPPSPSPLLSPMMRRE
jgi:hypothetical protein